MTKFMEKARRFFLNFVYYFLNKYKNLNIIDNKRLKKDIDIVIFNLMMMI
jgi:hypothetical protein